MASTRHLLAVGLAASIAGAAGCGDDAGVATDAGPAVDATGDGGRDASASRVDAGLDDAGFADAGLDGDLSVFPLAGFGDISGMCDALASPELTAGGAPLLLTSAIEFSDRYDDPEDRPLLTTGGVEIILDGNAGGSSLYSEVFAFELLARCELAALLKTETEILYDVDGKKTDLLVSIDAIKLGVSVTRAVTFPFGSPYTPEAATELLDRKLDDITVSSANVAAADRWEKQLLAVLAYDEQHAEVAAAAWADLDAETRADTVVLITTTAGDDLFIYTDQ